MTKLICHVISNTHWDREWRYPFQSYRMDLVDMMDRLLEILENDSDYHAFFLDSQTVILEDYLEIRPENKKRIVKLVNSDKLQIGPWYTLPDEWACHGEALVRNLLMGHRVGSVFGKISKVGYTPFSNGQISQLPQIYQGFGIDTCFFYRGIGKHIAKSDFIWESPDGSRVVGFRFGDYARYNYYYLVYRPGLLGRFNKDRDYIWDPEEIPYHIANMQSQDRQYGWINQHLKIHEENLKQAIDDCRKNTIEDATTNQLLYMMGHDHSFAHEAETDLINAINQLTDSDKDEIKHSSLQDYITAFKKESKVLDVFFGEMRHTNKIGLWTNLMAMILSCRTYLKQQNCRINTKILNCAEPMAAFAWITGSEYPFKIFEIAWKKLLINQAHDAVGGCSVDRVHREMQARWEEVDTISDEICRRSMRDIALKIDGSKINKQDMQLTIFNTLPYNRSEVGDFVIDIPTTEPSIDFSIEKLNGENIPMQLISNEGYNPTIEGGYELSMPFAVQRFNVKLFLENLPSMGYETFVIKPNKQPPILNNNIVKSERELENEYLKIFINDNGTIKLTDKKTGYEADNICYFEDTAEFGDPWNRVVPTDDKPIYSLNEKAEISVLTAGALEGAIRIFYLLNVPSEKLNKEHRSPTMVAIPITIIVSLKIKSPLVDIKVILNNTAKDHRLRILFPTNLKEAEYSFAEGQFDVLKRAIKLPESEGWKEHPYPTNPMWNFVDVSDGAKGFSVINDGLIEYEVTDDEKRAIAITLIRGFGKFVYERPTPEAQCLGEHCYRFKIYPHEGYWYDTDIFKQTAFHNVNLQAIQSAPTQGILPPIRSFIDISPGSVVLSGIKQSEDKKFLILRLWNTLEQDDNMRIRTSFKIKKAALMTLEEKVIEDLYIEDKNVISIPIPKKKIMTIGIWVK